jgi:hypothetical protein
VQCQAASRGSSRHITVSVWSSMHRCKVPRLPYVWLMSHTTHAMPIRVASCRCLCKNAACWWATVFQESESNLCEQLKPIIIRQATQKQTHGTFVFQDSSNKQKQHSAASVARQCQGSNKMSHHTMYVSQQEHMYCPVKHTTAYVQTVAALPLLALVCTVCPPTRCKLSWSCHKLA